MPAVQSLRADIGISLNGDFRWQQIYFCYRPLLNSVARLYMSVCHAYYHRHPAQMQDPFCCWHVIFSDDHQIIFLNVFREYEYTYRYCLAIQYAQNRADRVENAQGLYTLQLIPIRWISTIFDILLRGLKLKEIKSVRMTLSSNPACSKPT